MRRGAGPLALVLGASAVAGALCPASPSLPRPEPRDRRASPPTPAPTPTPDKSAGALGEREDPGDSSGKHIEPPPLPPTGYAALAPITFVSEQSGDRATVRLYRPDGSLDEEACRQLEGPLADGRKPPRPFPTTSLDRRLLKLVFKAAYHFAAREITVVSGYRKPGRFPEGMHGKGKAVDVRLDSVEARPLSEYLRTIGKVGVGLYTHPKTRFVHLDVRDASYHWLDGTPPGRRWGEWGLPRQGLAQRDERHHDEDDLPDLPAASARPPSPGAPAPSR